MKRNLAMGLIASLLSLSSGALAHHSGAMFDRSKEVTITGTVKEFNWTNPHASFALEVTGQAGAVDLWAIEMNPPTSLVRQGWKRTTLKTGDKVTAVINPLRDGKPGGWYVGISLPDGTSLGGAAPH